MEDINLNTKPLLLLVDDDKSILSFLSDILEPRYDVLKAESGEEAVELLKEQSVQLVISDVMMSGMDGFELCNFIKSDFDHSHIPVILLTAKNSLQSRIEGLEQGADAYIDKPFSPKHLSAQIENLLANRSKIRHYFAQSPLVHISTMAYSKSDEEFLERVNEAILENLRNTDLNVDSLADIMNMSRSTLYRKIKAISDLTVNELIKITRLKKAAGLLATGDYKVYEVSEIVGYNSQNYFAKSFSKQFGITASEYITAQTQ